MRKLREKRRQRKRRRRKGIGEDVREKRRGISESLKGSPETEGSLEGWKESRKCVMCKEKRKNL